MVILITYDLNKPGQDYSDLYEEIEKFGENYHLLESVWLVDTDLSTDQISERLRSSVIDENDSLFVVRLQEDYSGWLPKKAWNWIEERVF